jgi:hypothetical protein
MENARARRIPVQAAAEIAQERESSAATRGRRGPSDRLTRRARVRVSGRRYLVERELATGARELSRQALDQVDRGIATSCLRAALVTRDQGFRPVTYGAVAAGEAAGLASWTSATGGMFTLIATRTMVHDRPTT